MCVAGICLIFRRTSDYGEGMTAHFQVVEFMKVESFGKVRGPLRGLDNDEEN